MAAFAAAEETDLAFICCSELPEPPECKIVLAFRTLRGDGGKRANLPILLFNDNNLPLAPFFPDQHLIILADLPDIPALPAFQLTRRGDHEALALRTEHGALLFASMRD